MSATGGRTFGLVISLLISLATKSVLLELILDELEDLGGPGEVPRVTTLTVSVSLEIGGDEALGIDVCRSINDD